MLIALLALLGVNLVVVAALLLSVLSRKRWVKRQPGAFKGKIRVATGEIDGLPSKWRPGYGRWIGEVFVWTKAPFLFRNELVAIDGVDEQRPARPDEVKRLGDHPVVARLRTQEAAAEVAAHASDGELLLGPLPNTPGAYAAPA